MSSVGFFFRFDTQPAGMLAARIAVLRTQGHGWKKIAASLGVEVGTVLRSARGLC